MISEIDDEMVRFKIVERIVETIVDPTNLNNSDHEKLFETVKRFNPKQLKDFVVTLAYNFKNLDDSISKLEYNEKSLDFLEKVMKHVANELNNKFDDLESFDLALTIMEIHGKLFSWNKDEYKFVKSIIEKHKHLLKRRYDDVFDEERRMTIIKYIAIRFEELLDEDLMIEILENLRK